ncbi:MAG: hypothetical protein MJ082_03550 [Clostridia bacterium]|nr:hypothetical protein [Clostridia bacterium]
MTDIKRKTESFRLFLLLILWGSLLFFGKYAAAGLLSGLKQALLSVIPAVFPFMILAEAAKGSIRTLSKTKIASLFGRLFSLPPESFPCFLCGILCGFPTGAKAVSDFYEKGVFTENEASFCIALSASASPGFFLFAVGLGLLGSVKYGVLLLFCSLFGGLLAGLLTHQRKTDGSRRNLSVADESPVGFSVIGAIRNASVSCLYLAGTFAFFGAVGGIVSHVIADAFISSLIRSVLDLGTGCTVISELSFPRPILLALLAFTLGHSGLCVFFQLSSVCEDFPLNAKVYFNTKLLQALFSALLCIAVGFLLKI